MAYPDDNSGLGHIDYIFSRQDAFRVLEATVHPACGYPDGMCISDHSPIDAVLKLPDIQE